MKMKTSELTGVGLDYAVARCECDEGWLSRHLHLLDTMPYSTDWGHGGPIIEREKFDIECRFYWAARLHGHSWSTGPTPLIAAMRCFVDSQIGKEIDIPDELFRR
jgi:Protein of unknown function (DUF2591)